jgi:flavodoxin I
MAKIGLFFATDTGNTRKVAKMIKKHFDDGDIQPYNVTKATADELQQYDSMIFGTPTLGDGELPDTLLEFMPVLESVDFTGKTVALFGLGDQEGYPDEFVDALGILYKKLKKLGASFVGSWPNEGYEFDKSKALINDEFVGLVIDQDNQSDMTAERVEEWVEQVKPLLLKEAVAG